MVVLLLGACKKKKINNLKTEFKENYATIVHASYEDAYNEAIELQTAINSFVDSPSEAGFNAANKLG